MKERVTFVGVVLSLSAAAILVSAPSAGAGGNGGYGCATGFDLGANTLDQYLLLPHIQAGIAAGLSTAAGYAGYFNFVDKNGDGVVCVKTEPASGNDNASPSAPGQVLWQLEYKAADNNSAATTG